MNTNWLKLQSPKELRRNWWQTREWLIKNILDRAAHQQQHPPVTFSLGIIFKLLWSTTLRNWKVLPQFGTLISDVLGVFCIICYYFSIEVKPSLEKEDRLPAVLEIWRNRFMGTPSKSPPLNPLKTPKLEMENSSKAFLPLEKNALEDALVSMHFQLLLFRVKITWVFFRLFSFLF